MMDSRIDDATTKIGDIGKTNIFVSYSRRDSRVVDKLVASLGARKALNVFRDTEDILPAEEWRLRLESLIGDADTILFCISPHSVKSEVCAWEVERAEQLNKRIIPIVLREVVSGTPEGLSRLNYIYFTEADDFDKALNYLFTAIDADIDWIREHTRLGNLAVYWVRSEYPTDQLLRGSDIDAADQWLARRPQNGPAPTNDILDYLKTSREEASYRLRRARWAQAGVFALFFLMFVAVMAWFNQTYLENQWLWLTNVRNYVLSAEAVKKLKSGDAFTECRASCPEMIVVPAGSFFMGSDNDESNERQRHKVTIGKPFAVSRYEITYNEWDACTANGVCVEASTYAFGRGSRPVVNVSWKDANVYVQWLTSLTGKAYRLLSEAEWEYVARAGTTTPFFWGNSLGDGNANCEKCGGEWAEKWEPAPVGSFKPNAFGVYDMHGNVWEWVADPYHKDYTGAPDDGSVWIEGGSAELRVIRGGGFSYKVSGLRASARLFYGVDYKWNNLGFRIARDLRR